MKVLTVLFLVAAIFAGCVNLPVAPLEFTMYCDVCGRETIWGGKPDYFYCRQSGTTWEGS